MKIRRMTATFGKLDKAELTLDAGLNILELPNEGGKSTWSAFLLAMFYGIDTSERASKGTLPAKTKYKPWSGAAMEGRVELEWNGREITIERRSKGRVPMGEFRAYETESGLPVRELTAENCGQQLLGVEKAVFERSAFLRQAGHAVTQDGALERRLSALVSTGEETVSYSDTERRLRDWKNACRHNQTGELPKLERQLEQTERTREQIRGLQERVVSLRADEETKNAELLRLTRLEKGLQAAENRKKREALARAEVRCAALREKADAAWQSVADLPKEETLRNWQQEWTEIQTQWRAVPVGTAKEPEPPVLPAVFAGKMPVEIKRTAEEAVRNYDAFAKAAQPSKQPVPWLAIAAAVVCAALCFLKLWQIALVPLALAAASLAVYLRNGSADRREASNAAFEADVILQQYGVMERDAILRLAERSIAELNRYEEGRRQVREAEMRRQTMAEAVRQRESVYLTKLDAALPDFSGEPTAALQEMIARIRAAEQLCREAEAAERHHADLAENIHPDEETAETAEIPEGRYDIRDVIRRKDRILWELREIRTQLDRSQGQISAMGDPAALEAQQEQLLEQIGEQQARFAALSLAMDVLEQANDGLQTRFAPEISRRAESIMGRLTDGRYDRVLLDQSLAIAVRETGEVASRELNRLSCGTADQLYLAVRLAICGAVLAIDTPLILDDALVNFDDIRLARTMALLREEGQRRQILLFTCQHREKTYIF